MAHQTMPSDASTSSSIPTSSSNSTVVPSTGNVGGGTDSGNVVSNNEPPQVLKLLMIGSSAVGKSSMLLRFTDEMFLGPEEVSATVGVDFKVKVIEKGGKRYKLSIWDTAGQERFRTLTSSYYRGAQGVILVYDVTNRETFDSLTSWFNELDTFSSSDVVRAVVGNKVDKEYSRTVTREEAEKFAASRDPPCLYFESSAKRGEGIDKAFDGVVEKILERPQLYLPSATGRRPGGGIGTGPPGKFPGGGGSETVKLTYEDDRWGYYGSVAGGWVEAGSRYCSC